MRMHPRAAALAAALAFGPLASGAALAQGRGTVVTDWFDSRALGVRKLYVVYLPPSYDAAPLRRYPVAYYLHGAWGNESDWVQKGGLDVVMDSLIAAGMPEMIVVMPDGDDGFWTDWATDAPDSLCLQRRDLREEAERYCVRHPRYDRYVSWDLVRQIDAIYRTRADAAHRGVAGLSMGGFGAMALAANHPDVFSAAASHSGGVSLLALSADTLTDSVAYGANFDFWRERSAEIHALFGPVFGPGDAGWWARDPARRLVRLSQREERVPALYADVGTEDPLLVESRAFRIALGPLRHRLSYHEYPGVHDWPFWRAHVGESLAWLAGHIAR